MASNSIRYAGLSKLSSEEQDALKRIMQKESLRITRMIPDRAIDLIVTVKVHNTGGERKRYLVFLRTDAPSRNFAVQTKEIDVKKSGEWDLAIAARKAIEKLAFEVKHKLHADMEPWKKREKKRSWKNRLGKWFS